ncbi:MAG: YybH family protein [Planctomycetota bacterium]|jgi:uncharacterized protein (TIGR02246 family)
MDTKVDLKAEEQNLRELAHKLLEAQKRKDLDTVMTFYTEDTIAQLSEGPQIKGPEAIRTFLEQVLFEAPIKDVHVVESKTVVSSAADMAYDVGRCRLLYEEPNRCFEEMATYLRVWQKVHGQWKIAVAYWNSNEGGQ